MRNFLSIATAACVASAAPAVSATISDDAASVWLFGGDVIVDSAAPLSDVDGLDLDFLTMSGGAGFDPEFSLWVDGPSGSVLQGDVTSYAFDDAYEMSFIFSVAGTATAYLGDLVELTLVFDDMLNNPFGADASYSGFARMSLTSAIETPAVPLPATLPLLAAALVVPSVLKRRRKS